MAATEFELQVLSTLSDIKAMASATQQKVVSLDDRLFNAGSGVVTVLQADIAEVKAEKTSDAKWDKIHNILHYSIPPVLVALHELARKMGISI
jgi:ATP-dependent Clp protease adapter protein ClpS